MQESDEGVLNVLPRTGGSVKVHFHGKPPQQLSAEHKVVSALLRVNPKGRQGCFSAAMPQLCNLMEQPPFCVLDALKVCSSCPLTQRGYDLCTTWKTLIVRIEARDVELHTTEAVPLQELAAVDELRFELVNPQSLAFEVPTAPLKPVTFFPLVNGSVQKSSDGAQFTPDAPASTGPGRAGIGTGCQAQPGLPPASREA